MDRILKLAAILSMVVVSISVLYFFVLRPIKEDKEISQCQAESLKVNTLSPSESEEFVVGCARYGDRIK